jgi:hypothetical protein
MYPHERSLVKQYENQPFVILGVNSDADRAAVRETAEKENLTWRSFWDGGSTQGPIATKWNVRGWPTIYIIDAEGVIRYKSVGANEEAISKTIEGLIHK